MLTAMTTRTANRIKGWCRVLYWDAGLAMVVGIAVTSAFLIAGAGVLGPAHVAPEGAQVLENDFPFPDREVGKEEREHPPSPGSG